LAGNTTSISPKRRSEGGDGKRTKKNSIGDSQSRDTVNTHLTATRKLIAGTANYAPLSGTQNNLQASGKMSAGVTTPESPGRATGTDAPRPVTRQKGRSSNLLGKELEIRPKKRGRRTHYFRDGYPMIPSAMGWHGHGRADG
jgi:hypothetical protein